MDEIVRAAGSLEKPGELRPDPVVTTPVFIGARGFRSISNA
jgi:hypothetical protein